ncbi:tautomerase family protein [Pseudoclavibacter chungangensis]|uniref:Tautomerase family protein n=1 Tax=Pseudoclavibacter chungangensis TaxID=587635 RepID=A0A7J5BQQ5_9MICO|nr:tautomerase family protein [Pseudoclavibacter chungangensis]KAB1656354.1 tautomerase family protein [Pseudoclavibacter chungangensis]NYJ67126.1 phenylpyruvate tautomerase PptA (4-oxalocrotonate tautomerase family) [Pseudoclavibacter chungangensis]
MPLIAVHVLKGHDETYLTSLLDTIHEAVVEAFEVPETDRYQVLTQHEPFEIRALDTGLGFTRSDRLTIVRVISKARPEAAKERLYALLAQKLDETPGVPPEDLVVSVVENSSADWSFGAGRAQFLTGELPTS